MSRHFTICIVSIIRTISAIGTIGTFSSAVENAGADSIAVIRDSTGNAIAPAKGQRLQADCPAGVTVTTEDVDASF